MAFFHCSSAFSCKRKQSRHGVVRRASTCLARETWQHVIRDGTCPGRETWQHVSRTWDVTARVARVTVVCDFPTHQGWSQLDFIGSRMRRTCKPAFTSKSFPYLSALTKVCTWLSLVKYSLVRTWRCGETTLWEYLEKINVGTNKPSGYSSPMGPIPCTVYSQWRHSCMTKSTASLACPQLMTPCKYVLPWVESSLDIALVRGLQISVNLLHESETDALGDGHLLFHCYAVFLKNEICMSVLS